MKTCAHCGAKLRHKSDEEPSFCCLGCQTVYQILQEKKRKESKEDSMEQKE